MPLIDPVLLESTLGPAAGHFTIIALDECDSTSSESMRRADQGAPDRTVVVADRQSASAPAASLTFSLLWHFRGPSGKLSGLSLAVGVALARGLESLGTQGVRLKWPNDVLLESAGEFAKLAGILVELVTDYQGTQAVIGIGVNLQAPGDDLPQPATGLNRALMPLPDRHLVLAAILSLVADDGTAVDGICEGVDDDGALLLATAAGVRRIFSGDVSLRRA